jgi:hypothetical protein
MMDTVRIKKTDDNLTEIERVCWPWRTTLIVNMDNEVIDEIIENLDEKMTVKDLQEVNK